MDEVFRILESDFAELISPVIFAFPFGGGIGKELQTSSFFVTGNLEWTGSRRGSGKLRWKVRSSLNRWRLIADPIQIDRGLNRVDS